MSDASTSKFRRTDRNNAPSILVIESDPLMLTAMGSVLHMQGYRAVLARTEAMALDVIVAGQFDVIVLSIDDLHLGCDFASRLRKSEMTSDVPIIFLVPVLSIDWTEKLAERGGVFSMLKPVEPNGLIELVDKALWLPHVARGRLGAPGTHLAKQTDWVSLPRH